MRILTEQTEGERCVRAEQLARHGAERDSVARCHCVDPVDGVVDAAAQGQPASIRHRQPGCVLALQEPESSPIEFGLQLRIGRPLNE